VDKKEELIVDIMIFYNWDKMCADYEYDQYFILEEALRVFPNSTSDRIDIRQKIIKLMEASPDDLSVVIQNEKRKSELEGPTFECHFSFDNNNWIRGVFRKCAISFSSRDKISDAVRQKLIDFIKLHTSPQFYDEIDVHSRADH